MSAAEPVRRPLAWRIHPGDAARFAAEGSHCQGRRGTRRCRDPIAVVAWRWWRSSAAGRVLVSERFLCDEHAQQFADRYHIEIEPSPPERSRRRDTHGTDATNEQEP
jgi:hypothetical protein